jgi:hypothetical protein
MTQQYWKYSVGIALFSVVNIWFLNYDLNFYLYCIGGRNQVQKRCEGSHQTLVACGEEQNDATC